MILTRTPLRISFVGGGSDLRAFYKNEPGAVLSAAINRYIYITAGNHWKPNRLRVSYSVTENVECAEDLQHDLVRQAMLLSGFHTGIEITSVAEIPGRGSGLGSSSSYTVGLLNALHRLRGLEPDNEMLAGQACQIEITNLAKPIGKQDQYAAAYGGLNLITFNPDESVVVEPVQMSLEKWNMLQSRLMLFWTGIARGGDAILAEQTQNTKTKSEVRSHLYSMVRMAHMLKEGLELGDLDLMGHILHEGWLYKKKLSSRISMTEIDHFYDRAMQAGAKGGKLLGAGGGGFLLFYVRKQYQESVRRELGLRQIPIKIGVSGTTCLLNDQAGRERGQED